jgi:hypothetical protein
VAVVVTAVVVLRRAARVRLMCSVCVRVGVRVRMRGVVGVLGEVRWLRDEVVARVVEPRVLGKHNYSILSARAFEAWNVNVRKENRRQRA